MKNTALACATIAVISMNALAASSYTQKKELEFDTKDGWIKTDIVLKEGQKIKIKAKGKWKPSVNNSLVITANGIDEERWVKYSIDPDIPHGRLIGYIDGAPKQYYRLGQSETIKAKIGGKLVIGVNDKEGRSLNKWVKDD